ncbi:MAG: immune inhibitor A [Anaerolineae bacterium]|nr:immune inhibitor A [Anaerolineae bacterium]
MNSNKHWLWGVGIIIVLALTICLCICCVLGTGMMIYFIAEDSGQISQANSFLEPESTPLPPITGEMPSEALETLQALTQAETPDADLHELGIRFRGVDPDTPRVAATTSPDYAEGTIRTFTVSDVDKEEQFEIEAELVYKTAHVYMWVEKDASFDEDDLREAADLFEEHTYPTDREFFGSEWSPGVDGDPHVSILHARNLGATVAGYFSSPDEYVRAVRADSNEMEMFYINLDNINIGSSFYNGVLAHEFQHMIHWRGDRNETTWLNEGCSELAMALNERSHEDGDYNVGGSDISYSYAPDTQLNSWPEGAAGDASANYGGSYLFMEYFLDQFGEDATQALVARPENGLESVDAVLASLGNTLDHKIFFANWTIANLLDDPTLSNGEYGYREINPHDPTLDIHYDKSDCPVRRISTVHQYGVDYIEIEGHDPLTFTFAGGTRVKILDTNAFSGKHLWWSGRNDESDSSLTRIVNLENATTATLRFQSWYHIEENWDYGYVIVGTTASGQIPSDLTSPQISWEILADSSLGCTTDDPNGNSFGCGLTGQSRGWQELTADLGDYTGGEIVLRFEYITDAAVNQPSWALDDIEIVTDGELLFQDDGEKEIAGWIPTGFVRHANVLPQEWIVQLVTYEGSHPQISRLLLADDTEGEWLIPLNSETKRAVITVSAIAPITTETATYEFNLQLAE